MQETLQLSTCGCPQPSTKLPKKNYHEIGAEVIGNQLLIRVEKDKKKVKSQWDPPCDCEIPEIRLSSDSEGPKIINAGSNNQIIFQINSKSHVESPDPTLISEIKPYELGDHQDELQGRTIVVHSQVDGGDSQEIQRDHITVGNQNIFMMKIKKKSDAKERKNRNVELEVCYPIIPERVSTPFSLPPPPPPTPPPPVNLPEVKNEAKETPKAKKGKGKRK
ncbi:uncharacterized protein LOC135160057 [Diachasmimorpha longicaudata]|uniref:uncharacterized protein LOC135160057 n=1 Tax=Diachasmimorpha longicaudata TaxID=58733 RepID=UPI0030B8DF5D